MMRLTVFKTTFFCTFRRRRKHKQNTQKWIVQNPLTRKVFSSQPPIMSNSLACAQFSGLTQKPLHYFLDLFHFWLIIAVAVIVENIQFMNVWGLKNNNKEIFPKNIFGFQHLSLLNQDFGRGHDPSPVFWLDLNFSPQYQTSLTVGSDRALPDAVQRRWQRTRPLWREGSKSSPRWLNSGFCGEGGTRPGEVHI